MVLKKTAMYKKQKLKKCDKIFVAGIEHRVGATHFSILLANYRANLLRQKVALVDFNKDNDYMNLGEGLGDINLEKAFVKDKVTYYPSATKDILEEIFLKDYDCIIIDVGNSYMKYKIEAGLCDFRYLIISSTLWRNVHFKEEYENYFSKYKNSKWRILYSFGSVTEAKEIENELGEKIYKIPYVETPFKVERRILDMIEKAIGEG
ncbi:MAG: hypothetical protein IJA34_14935 [Lachnospiraceae bacterium]|nr:hypothetical protein [Lachnospiraceae bacterium]